MTSLFMLFLLAAQPPPASLEQVKAEVNPEHRARLAIDYAAIAEKNAEGAYEKGNLDATAASLKEVEASVQTAQESLIASHKPPGRHPGPYKYAELRSRDLLIRLGDLERRMDLNQQSLVDGVKNKIQEIHDAWFEGIMERAK
jgi:hypothetical protein